MSDRKPLMDTITCIREHCTIDQAGFRLAANAERHVKPPEEIARLFRRHPEAVMRTMEIADRCRFSLDDLRYEYPDDEAPPGTTPQEELTRLTWEGAEGRYPDGLPEKVCKQIIYELKLIGELNYAPYFLTVHDIVRYARSRAFSARAVARRLIPPSVTAWASLPSILPGLIFCSSASYPPNGMSRQISMSISNMNDAKRSSSTYTKNTAANALDWRQQSFTTAPGWPCARSAKSWGSPRTIATLVATVWGWRTEGIKSKHIREAGLDPDDKRLSLAIRLARELTGFPRHLSQHVGGFVITRGLVGPGAHRQCRHGRPDHNRMGQGRPRHAGHSEDRRARPRHAELYPQGFDLLERHYGRKIDLATVPAEDPAVYDMLCQADLVGVFQVESRAQMTMLPRLKPRNFYDLVIEVAIVRPGPIQGDMVHPYLRRRNGEEEVDFPSEELRNVLGKTYGIPLFQEQAMKIAIIAGGFTLRSGSTTPRHGHFPPYRNDPYFRGKTDQWHDR